MTGSQACAEHEGREPLILYNLCSRKFRQDFVLGDGTKKPNALSIEREYGCHIFFGKPYLPKRGDRFHIKYLPPYRGLGSHIVDGGLSAVIVGKDPKKVTQAQRKIYHEYGVGAVPLDVIRGVSHRIDETG